MDPSQNLAREVRNGNLEEVTKIITKYGISHRPEWGNGYTLLRAAVENGETDVALFLLGSGCNVESKRSRTVPTKTVLHLAALNCNLEILHALLDKGADVNVTDKDGRTPLHEAVKRTQGPSEKYRLTFNSLRCRKGEITKHNMEDFLEAAGRKMAGTTVTQEELGEFVKVILDKGADVNIADKDGNTPLHEAVKRKDAGAIVLLMEYGANVNTRNKNGEMPLQVALVHGLFMNAEHLVKHGADVNSVWANFCGSTPLHYAAYFGNERIVKILLDKGANVNVTDDNGNTPLHKAVKSSEVGITALLLEYGANINARNKNAEMPIQIASDKGLIRNAEHLPQHGSNVNRVLTKYSNSGCTPLHYAAEYGYKANAKILLDKGADVNITNQDGNTPLHLDLKRGGITSVLLLEYGAHVNARNKNGEMPLHVALERDYVGNELKHLLKHGADVNSVMTNNSKDGYTPLHYAVKNGHFCNVYTLLTIGAHVNAIGKGRTPLHLAAERGHENITETLLKHGADVNCMCTANSSEGYSPLHFAVRNGHVNVARILLDSGAYIDAKNKSGHTILHEAVSTAKTSMVGMVLNYRPDVNNENNRSSLNLALNGLPRRYKDIVELLLQNGFNIRDEADVKAVSGSCMSSIRAASLNGYVTVLEALLKHGASANSKDEKGKTPLHAAAKKGNLQAIETLLKYGADINSRDQNGNTALHIASWVGDPNVVRLLLDYGSDVNITTSSRHRRTALDYAKLRDNILDRPRDPRVTSFRGTIEILEKHIIKVKTTNPLVCHKNLRSIMLKQRLLDFEELCKHEFETLRGTVVGNSNHSFYHLLSKSIHQLAIILQDDSVSRCIKSDRIREKFPQYGSIICGHLTFAKHRRKILDEINACDLLIFPKLNLDCIQKIIAYLSNGDLINVIHACKRKPTAL